MIRPEGRDADGPWANTRNYTKVYVNCPSDCEIPKKRSGIHFHAGKTIIEECSIGFYDSGPAYSLIGTNYDNLFVVKDDEQEYRVINVNGRKNSIYFRDFNCLDLYCQEMLLSNYNRSMTVGAIDYFYDVVGMDARRAKNYGVFSVVNNLYLQRENFIEFAEMAKEWNDTPEKLLEFMNFLWGNNETM